MIVDNGYIVAVETTDDNFEAIKKAVANKPQDVDGYQYRLRLDTLEYELVKYVPLPPIDEQDDEATESDYIEALQDLGVEVN